MKTRQFLIAMSKILDTGEDLVIKNTVKNEGYSVKIDRCLRGSAKYCEIIQRSLNSAIPISVKNRIVATV